MKLRILINANVFVKKLLMPDDISGSSSIIIRNTIVVFQSNFITVFYFPEQAVSPEDIGFDN
ncbi:MAG: hypothetical protein ACT6FD_03305 [Methanosarcinaceae archaeon]